MLSIVPESISVDIAKAGGGHISFEKLERGLVELQIIRNKNCLVSYRDLHSWHRGGGETYVSDFVIEFLGEKQSLQQLHIIGKAILSLTDVETRWKQWKRRFSILEAYGVCVPNNFSYWKGVIFQEYIPFDFCSYFTSRPLDERSFLAEKLIDCALKIDTAGFHVTGFLHNVRTNGKDIYIVDVGEDLGEPGVALGSTKTSAVVGSWIKSLEAEYARS